jgi:hypothetical protein
VIPALELLCFYAVVFLAIWGGRLTGVRPPGALAAVALLAFCATSARRRGDSRETLGLDRRWLRPSVRLTVLWAGPPLLALLLWALKPPLPTMERVLYGAAGLPPSFHGMPAGMVLFLGVFRYPLWAFVQEYALLSFCGNRWREVAGNVWAAALVNGALFALVHAPNPILMGACLVSGVVFTRIFYEAPHLAPPALAHAAAGLLLSVIFRDFYPAMMVGPAYLRWAGSAVP